VWLVFGGEYEQWYFAGAFSSKEKAVEKVKSHKGYYIHDDNGEIVDEEDASPSPHCTASAPPHSTPDRP
jgi:hypothetical protein